MKRIEHAEASSRFIKAKDHLDFHDKRLWDLRKKRDRVTEQIPEWEELRTLASAIKEHALTHLAGYLEEFERNAIKNGAHVHWAKDAAEHNQIVFEIMHAPQRMHLSEYQKSAMPKRSARPLSTSTICICVPARGARKCDVSCVIGEPSALRDNIRTNTPRSSIRGTIFSMPIDAM